MTLSGDRLENELSDKKPLLTGAEAKAEAERCLYCADAPCIAACPTEIDVPTFIKKIASGNLRGSARTILEQNLLGYSCGRVCPVEVLCAGSCVYTAWGREPIAIGRLQRFATETAPGAPVVAAKVAKTGKRAACIGGGPASLAFAGYLAMEGHEAVIFEQKSVAGGLNTTGIAPYKLHATDALHEVELVRGLGVTIDTGVEITAEKAKELLERYDAVFLGVGLGADTRLGLPGEDGPGVHGATAWIEQMKLEMGRGARREIEGKTVLVVGGGNTAIDVARECAQLGAAEVSMVYRRSAADMRGYDHEMDAARVEGVRLLTRALPVGYVRDASGKLTGVRITTTDASARPVAGSERVVPCDMVALAVGQSKLRGVGSELPGVQLDERGCVVTDETTCATGNPRVFAGGDCVNGGKEVVNAVADGRNAARALMARWAQK